MYSFQFVFHLFQIAVDLFPRQLKSSNPSVAHVSVQELNILCQVTTTNPQVNLSETTPSLVSPCISVLSSLIIPQTIP